jgi:hypothetical protein
MTTPSLFSLEESQNELRKRNKDVKLTNKGVE